jgi:hypothetical protein
MSVCVTLPDDLASRLAHEAERRSMTPDELAVTVLAEHIPDEVAGTADAAMSKFLGIGASTDGRTAAEAEEMLAERFGR